MDQEQMMAEAKAKADAGKMEARKQRSYFLAKEIDLARQAVEDHVIRLAQAKECLEHARSMHAKRIEALREFALEARSEENVLGEEKR